MGGISTACFGGQAWRLADCRVAVVVGGLISFHGNCGAKEGESQCVWGMRLGSVPSAAVRSPGLKLCLTARGKAGRKPLRSDNPRRGVMRIDRMSDGSRPSRVWSICVRQARDRAHRLSSMCSTNPILTLCLALSNATKSTTFSSGYLGYHDDEERSETRY